MASRARRRRLRMKAKKRTEIIYPTPERLAKGDVVRLQSGQIKSNCATFLDVIAKKEVFFDELDGEDMYFALAFMLDLTERSGLFASATRNISALSFVSGSSPSDMSAADEWRYIMKSLSLSARRVIVDLLSDTRPRDPYAIYLEIEHIRELTKTIEKFRFEKLCLTKSKK